MKANDEKKEIFLSPHGLIAELARLTGFSRITVRTALRNGAKGLKAEKVRQLYKQKYLQS